jgi:endonuclease/exonuclease/phosphatase family metal-dependent hydrolase
MTGTKPTIRIATINLLNNPSGFGKRANLLARDLRQIQPDVLCLQEIASLEEPQLVALMEQLGYVNSYAASRLQHRNGFFYGNMTFSRLPIVAADELTLKVPKAPSTPVAGAVVHVQKAGKTFTVINVHLSWGANNEWVRLRQVEEIADYAAKLTKEKKHPLVLAGDFNSPPRSTTYQFLTGNREGSRQNGTFWIDAWDMWGTPENEITSDPSGYWAAATAKPHGLDPDLIPKRRIDYLMAYEWCYGRSGSPMNFQRFADVEDKNGMTASDHFGLWADFLL